MVMHISGVKSRDFPIVGNTGCLYSNDIAGNLFLTPANATATTP